MKKLSKTAKIKEYLIDFTAEHGYFPTFQNIRDKFELKSVSTVYYHLQSLEKEGVIEQKRGKGKSYFIKNTGIYFKVPLQHKIYGRKLFRQEEIEKYFPVAREDVETLVVRIGDASLREHGLEKDCILFIKENCEKPDRLLVYLDKENNITISVEKLSSKGFSFLGFICTILQDS